MLGVRADCSKTSFFRRDKTMLQYLPYLGGFALLAFLCFGFWLRKRYKFWYAEGLKYKDVSYVPPRAGWLGRFFRWTVGRVTAFLFLGPVRIHNGKALKDPRRLVILPNHQTERDAVVIPRILGLRRVRYLIASSQVSPRRAMWVAFTGGISVHHDTNPGAAVRVTSDTLSKDGDTSLVIFPEGELHPDGEMKREGFHDGAIVIPRLAERLAGKRQQKEKDKERPTAVGRAAVESQNPPSAYAVVPTYIRYERDRKKAGCCQRLLLFFGLDRWRLFYGERTYGVDVYFGTPVSLSDLPEKNSDATTWVFEEISRLKAQTK
ncbi:MAG: 1-acyl-sn-glycerol-3-phosphate acyltransferase [Candidatus Obscuribacterales bacterium]|nr:1-acyl-sn-glycerol-3-phosphate acyltransferase [Candidatus Obscuribacterales bacterium]